MKDNEKTVSIDQLKLLNLATAYGLLVRVVESESKRLGGDHSLDVCRLFAANYLLDRKYRDDLWQSAMMSFLDVITKRTLMPGSPKEVVWPAWDPEDHFQEEGHPLTDVLIILFAWNEAVSSQTVSVDDYLGALFTFSGAANEGCYRGYKGEDENMKTLYGRYVDLLYAKEASRKDAEASFLKQLDMLASVINGMRN